jgi:hypothetical protein
MRVTAAFSLRFFSPPITRNIHGKMAFTNFVNNGENFVSIHGITELRWHMPIIGLYLPLNFDMEHLPES